MSNCKSPRGKKRPGSELLESLESVDDKRIKTTDMNSSVTKSDHLVDVSFGEIPQQSLYVQPMRMHFTRKIPEQNESVKLYWDMALEKESVMVFIYHRVDKRIILVKQFRPTVYVQRVRHMTENEGKPLNAIDWEKYSLSNGDVIEMCAGLMDKNKTPVETAKEEILEECGYDVQLEDIIHLKTYLTGIGISGPPQYLFYCEVDESMKAADGGGLKEEGEFVEVISITIEEAREMLNEKEVNSPSSVLYAISWFLQNKINVP